MRTVAARRTFELDGQANVVVTWFAPEQGDRCWECHFDISGLAKPIKRYSAGEDSAQALLLAVQGAAVRLYTCDEYKAGRLTLWGYRDLCLPTPNGFLDEEP